MIVGIVVVLAVTFSQRGVRVRRIFFGNALGYTAIVVLGLLAGACFMLFFRAKDWYEPGYAVLFGVGVVVLLAIRSYLELRWQRA
jgi:hypothetical protein